LASTARDGKVETGREDCGQIFEGMTQFGRALYAPNIEIISANSSQAKGRAMAVPIFSVRFRPSTNSAGEALGGSAATA